MAKEKYSYGYAQEKYKPLKQKEEKYNLKLKKGNYYIKCALIIKPNNGFLKTKGSRRDTLFALLQFHTAAEHSVDFLCRLFEITSVHAIVGTDSCRYVLVTEQLLNDFRILSTFK